MASLRQCFSWWCYRDRGVEARELLEAAGKIGYTGVEMIDQSLWPIVHDLGMKIVSDNCGVRIDAGLNDPVNHPELLDIVRRFIDLAEANSVRSLIVFSGNRREGLTETAGATHTVDALRQLAPQAEAAGVDLNIELLNSKIDHPFYQCDHTSWAKSVVDAVGSPRVKALYDIYHMQIMEGDLIRTIQENHPIIGHYHTAGNPGRRDMNDDQEIHYPPIYRAIAATGYDGFIGHEFIPLGNPIDALRTAFEQCRESLAKR